MTTNYQRALDLADHIAAVDESPHELVRQLDALGLIAPEMTDPTRPTLADMTPYQCRQCVGMWCDTGYFHTPSVYLGTSSDDNTPTQTYHYILNPQSWDEPIDQLPETITPRFDLPRAWNADGTPVDADQVEYRTDNYGYVYPQISEDTGHPPHTKVRRWVSDWEAVE